MKGDDGIDVDIRQRIPGNDQHALPAANRGEHAAGSPQRGILNGIGQVDAQVSPEPKYRSTILEGSPVSASRKKFAFSQEPQRMQQQRTFITGTIGFGIVHVIGRAVFRTRLLE